MYLRFILLEVNAKDYNRVVEERGNYKNTITKFDNILTRSKKQLYMEQIEHNKLKIYNNELQNKYNALLQNVEFIKYLDNHE